MTRKDAIFGTSHFGSSIVVALASELQVQVF